MFYSIRCLTRADSFPVDPRAQGFFYRDDLDNGFITSMFRATVIVRSRPDCVRDETRLA
jgi:hypothetical protein